MIFNDYEIRRELQSRLPIVFKNNVRRYYLRADSYLAKKNAQQPLNPHPYLSKSSYWHEVFRPKLALNVCPSFNRNPNVEIQNFLFPYTHFQFLVPYNSMMNNLHADDDDEDDILVGQ
jgi:hypothetical protein